MRNGQVNGHCCNFSLATFLLLSVIMRTAASLMFGNPRGPIYQGFIISLKNMEVSGGKDLGCHQWSNRKYFERARWLHFTSNKMDSQMCVNYCRIKGYNFAALSEGRKCSCANKISPLSKARFQYQCDKPCLGNMEYRCGGRGGFFELFEINTPDGMLHDGGTYVGCFKEEDNHKEEGSRQLTELFLDTTRMRVGQCFLSCHSQFRKYAALQLGTQCWCGDYPSTASLLNKASKSSSCNIPCFNTIETCGGKEDTQMYALNYAEQRETPLAIYYGCYNFGISKKDSDIMLVSERTKVEKNEEDAMSISRCCYLCKIKKKEYAGLHRGDTCYCSRIINIFRSFRLADDTCNRLCTENKKFFCGGDEVMQLYKL